MVATESIFQAEPATQQLDAPESASPATVLLVDDDARNLFALESVLEGEDYAIAKAQTGDEALLALMTQEFAAIVLDVQMPEVNGIRARPANQAAPAHTAYPHNIPHGTLP